MDCEQAHQLFDAYLDGELAGSLATELGAHRLQCPDCRRALALMEVTGHILATDPDPDVLDEGFHERLLACMDNAPSRWRQVVRHRMAALVPLAAAAVVALALLGVFNGRETRVAGVLQKGETRAPQPSAEVSALPVAPADADPSGDELLELQAQRVLEYITNKVESGQSIENIINLTIQQVLDRLDREQNPSNQLIDFPGADRPAGPSSFEPASSDEDSIEDL